MMTTTKVIAPYGKGKMMKSKQDKSPKMQHKGYPKPKAPSKSDRISMYR